MLQLGAYLLWVLWVGMETRRVRLQVRLSVEVFRAGPLGRRAPSRHLLQLKAVTGGRRPWCSLTTACGECS